MIRISRVFGKWMAALAGVSTMLVGGYAAGQDNLDRFTISGEDATVARSSVEISLDTAREIIDVCLTMRVSAIAELVSSFSSHRDKSSPRRAWTVKAQSTSRLG